MQPPIDNLQGQLVITGLPDLACAQINSFSDLIVAIPNYIAPTFPANQSNLVVSAAEPSNSKVTKLWLRYDNAGNIIGLYGFTAGKWHPIQPIVEGDFIPIVWLVGNSAVPPVGYTLIDNTGPASIPAGVRTYLQTLYNGTDPQSYKAYIFSGY